MVKKIDNFPLIKDIHACDIFDYIQFDFPNYLHKLSIEGIIFQNKEDIIIFLNKCLNLKDLKIRIFIKNKLLVSIYENNEKLINKINDIIKFIQNDQIF